MCIRDSLSRTMATLSGGERRRIALARVLIEEPDILFLDEPTNHLDLDMIQWLERYLAQSKMTILMITHDRYFLENVCDTILELDDQTLYKYKGNYSYYLEKERSARKTRWPIVRRPGAFSNANSNGCGPPHPREPVNPNRASNAFTKSRKRPKSGWKRMTWPCA